MPETTFTFRVDQELKKAFPETVRANDRPDSQLLRDFMREYVERAAHDAWFRAEVEQSLKEADDPNAELTPPPNASDARRTSGQHRDGSAAKTEGCAGLRSAGAGADGPGGFGDGSAAVTSQRTCAARIARQTLSGVAGMLI